MKRCRLCGAPPGASPVTTHEHEYPQHEASTIFTDPYHQALCERAITQVLEEVAQALDALYERGPDRGSSGWGQAWGSGVLDAAALLRQFGKPAP